MKWSKEESDKLYKLAKSDKYTWPTISKLMGKTHDQCYGKWKNTDWKKSLKETDRIYSDWTNEESLSLYKLRTTTNLTYKELSVKFNRPRSSIQNKFQKTDWPKFLKVCKKKKIKATPTLTQEELAEQFSEKLVASLIEVARHVPERLEKITKVEFLKNVKLPSSRLPISYTELKRRATYQLEQIGFSHPSTKQLGKGTYIIVGDTHGKHTRGGIFRMLQTLSDYIEADKIIHIGHMLDDDSAENYYWDDFDNLYVLAKQEELRQLSNLHKYNIVRKEIQLGNLSVQNQDLITDYVQTPLSTTIIPDYFENSTVVNLHRHEMDSRCTPEDKDSLVASPGCLCEKHIVYTIKQQDFTDGRTVKQTFPTGYKKYRRMQHMFKKWQQGLLVVHVNHDGDFTIVQCQIHKTSRGFTTSYFDKIVSEEDVFDPDLKGFLNGDLHVALHDPHILDIQEQFCQQYKPDYHINLGDMAANTGLNHHRFKHYGSRLQEDVLDECARINFLMRRMRGWAKDSYILKGNHERFSKDFTDKFPQFLKLLDFEFVTGTKQLDIQIVDHDRILHHGNATYLHGNIRMFGQKGGNKYDKVFRTYGTNCVFGHCHHPASRSGCFSIGLSGKKDQNYNEVDASAWVHGFGYCNSYEDKAFICSLAIINNKVTINHNTIKPRNMKSWDFLDFEVNLQYNFQRSQLPERRAHRACI